MDGLTKAGLERAMKSDRKWFAKRFGVRFRFRPAIEGEAQPWCWKDGSKKMVLVVELEPGRRLKLPINWGQDEPVSLSQSELEILFSNCRLVPRRVFEAGVST